MRSATSKYVPVCSPTWGVVEDNGRGRGQADDWLQLYDNIYLQSMQAASI